jgi:hypothetical protein
MSRDRRLSAAEYQRKQDKYFNELDGQVHKTARVLAAEQRARAESAARHAALERDGKVDPATSLNAEVAAARRLAGGAGTVRREYLSKEQAEAGLDSYYKSLDKRDHIMPAVKQAEEKAKLGALHLKENEYREDEADARAQAATKEAVPGKTLTRRQAVQQQAAYFKQLDRSVHKTPAVLMAEDRAKAAKKALLYSAKEARKALAADISAVTKEGKAGRTLASDAMAEGKRAAARRKSARARGPRGRVGLRGKVDLRSVARDAVYGAHVPSLPGKIKLEWQGRQPAGQLYGRLKQQALASKGHGGSPRAATEEWDSHKNSLVDKMVDDFKHFKI